MARFLPESVKDGLAHEFERLEQTEGMSVSEYSARFTQLSRHAPYHITEEMRIKKFIRGLREYLFRSVVGSHCSTFAEVLSLALQIEQRQKDKGAPTALASSQVPSAPTRQMGNSSVQGAGTSQHEGRRSGGRGQMQAGRGQARVFALTRQDAQASNAVVTGILSICSQDAHVLFDPGATHSFVSIWFAPQLGKNSSSLDETLVVTTPAGDKLFTERWQLRKCPHSVKGKCCCRCFE
ncbi:hypothetical protein QL285_096159 [Trifolium repens]|nr:hypothetical protein QL285_096159 [Trifolium repens]